MGKMGVTRIIGNRRNIWLFEAFFGRFQAWNGPQGHPHRPPLVPNGRPSVPWEVKMKYFAMGWFYYGKNGCYSHYKLSKEYLMIWGTFWLWGAPNPSPPTPRGSPLVHNGQSSVPWDVQKNYFTMRRFLKPKACLLFKASKTSFSVIFGKNCWYSRQSRNDFPA